MQKHITTDKGLNALNLAVAAGNYFGEVNVVSYLIESGLELNEEETWHQLLMYGLNQDQTTFFRLANTYARGFISLNNLYDDKKVSLHKAIACKAKKVVDFYILALEHDQVD